MDYEKKYKKALERIKEYYDMGGQPSHWDLEYIFPELRESEDERIRKELVIHLEQEERSATLEVNKKRWREMISYLEKQKEQKPAEWSEEDEHRRQQAINALDRNGYYVLVDWLKSLRPSWKPSEEQMEALNKARRDEHCDPFERGSLDKLFIQLKKL